MERLSKDSEGKESCSRLLRVQPKANSVVFADVSGHEGSAQLFIKMALKAKKEATAPLRAEAKAKTVNAKKVVLKVTHSHKEKTFPCPKML